MAEVPEHHHDGVVTTSAGNRKCPKGEFSSGNFRFPFHLG
jgi:hypothetical protein